MFYKFLSFPFKNLFHKYLTGRIIRMLQKNILRKIFAEKNDVRNSGTANENL